MRGLPWVACLLLVGCGWHRGMVLPGNARTVGVEIFRSERRVFERGLESALHRELTRAVSDLVQAPLVPPEEADLVLRGAIEGYRRRGGIRNQDNRLLETGVLVEIQAELVPRRSLAAARDDQAVDPTSRTHKARVWSGHALDDAGNEAAARDQALRYLAETIVLELFADAPEAPEVGLEESPEGDGSEY